MQERLKYFPWAFENKLMQIKNSYTVPGHVLESQKVHGPRPQCLVQFILLDSALPQWCVCVLYNCLAPPVKH